MTSPVEPRLRNVLGGAFYGWVFFTVLVGFMTFGYIAVMGIATSVHSNIEEFLYNAASTMGIALIGLMWALVLGGSVGLLATGILGVPLAWVSSRLMREVASWRAHVAAQFGVGAVSAALAVLVYMTLAQDWSILDVAAIPLIASLTAGSSASLGWLAVWKIESRSTSMPEPRTYAESDAPR